jgi:hypothetical protein
VQRNIGRRPIVKADSGTMGVTTSNTTFWNSKQPDFSTSPNPWAWRRLIYFALEGAQICGRVNPNVGARDGGQLRLSVDLNNMHLLNDVTGVVL